MGNQGRKPHEHKYEEGDHAQHGIGVVINAGSNLVMLTHVDNIEGQLLQGRHHENQLLVMLIGLFKTQNAPVHQGVRAKLVGNQQQQVFDAVLQDLTAVGFIGEISQQVIAFACHQHGNATLFLGEGTHGKPHLVKIDIFTQGPLELVIFIPNRVRKGNNLTVNTLANRRPRIGKAPLAGCFQVPTRGAEFRLSAFQLQAPTRNVIPIGSSIVNVHNTFGRLSLLVKQRPNGIVLGHLLHTFGNTQETFFTHFQEGFNFSLHPFAQSRFGIGDSGIHQHGPHRRRKNKDQSHRCHKSRQHIHHRDAVS